MVRNNPDKVISPNKLFDAWAEGENMRYSGEARGFLDEIDNQEMKKISESSVTDKGMRI